MLSLESRLGQAGFLAAAGATLGLATAAGAGTVVAAKTYGRILEGARRIGDRFVEDDNAEPSLGLAAAGTFVWTHEAVSHAFREIDHYITQILSRPGTGTTASTSKTQDRDEKLAHLKSLRFDSHLLIRDLGGMTPDEDGKITFASQEERVAAVEQIIHAAVMGGRTRSAVHTVYYWRFFADAAAMAELRKQIAYVADPALNEALLKADKIFWSKTWPIA